MGYVETSELARVCQIRAPSAAQEAAMQRVIDGAAYEIDSYVFGTADLAGVVLGFGTPPYPPLVVEVNLERAREHWEQQEVPFGLIRTGGEIPVFSARDGWDRHARKLAYLRLGGSWGIA